MRLKHAGPLFLSLALSPLALAADAVPPAKPAAAPASQPADDPAYQKLLADLTVARQSRADAQTIVQRRLKELATDQSQKAADERILLLRQRREIDLRVRSLTRQFQAYWFGRQLTDAQDRAAFAEMTLEEKVDVLAGRTAAQRMAVPLPPATFTNAKLSEVVAYVQTETEARLVVDWPALSQSGARADALVTLAIPAFDRPAADMLAIIFGAVSNNRARIDAAHPAAVLVTTVEGEVARATLDVALSKRVADMRPWRAMDVPMEPASLVGVPLAEALFPPALHLDGGPKGSAGLLVDWAGLRDVGVVPTTTLNVGLPAHRIGHRLTAIAGSVEQSLWVRMWGGIRFDVLPTGGVLISAGPGFGTVSAAIAKLDAAAAADDELSRKVLAAPVPGVDNWDASDALLGELVAFVTESTGGAVTVDWPTLAACGLDPKTPVTLISADPIPIGDLLPLVLRPPIGRPAVEWEVKAGKIVARGPEKKRE